MYARQPHLCLRELPRSVYHALLSALAIFKMAGPGIDLKKLYGIVQDIAIVRVSFPFITVFVLC
jgi:hypothetical protein